MDITDTSVDVPEHNFLPKSRFDIEVTPNIDFLSTQQDSEMFDDEEESIDDAISHDGLLVLFQVAHRPRTAQNFDGLRLLYRYALA